MPETIPQNAEDILTQLVTGPSIREVAATALAPALGTLYPALKIDPTLATVVTPTWIITDDSVVPGENRYESLTDVLVRVGLSGSVVTFIDGEHFLTLQPGAEPLVHMPVKIDAIGRLINRLASQLFIAYQQQQLDYWNQETKPSTPRWHQLSRSLHNLWNTAPPADWDADQKAMARSLFDHPDRVTRRPQDKYLSKACLIDIDHLENAVSVHRQVLDTAVLVGTAGSRSLVLTHSISEGFKRYESLEALGETLAGRGQNLQWRLYEPEGNFFHHQACALIALETEAIGALQAFQPLSPAGLSAQVSAAAKHFTDFETLSSSHFNKVRGVLPRWLDKASTADLSRCSRHLMDLALLREQDGGKTFDEGIAALPEFALQALREHMIKDHPAAAGLALKDIEISITSVVVLGTIVLPGKTQTVTLSLSELALQNLIAVPLGNKTVQYTNGDPVPTWLSADYLERLVTQVDIGAVYPALIKSKLLDDPQESLRRQGLYTRHLRIQLSLQALQHKMRGEAGINECGYQYVVAALQENAADRVVNGQPIVIRPLAFVTGDRMDTTADEVANMFVIGPRHPDQGPCLLYRPLLTPSLMQYPSESNLLYAIKHDKALRQSVLAWLPDDVRFNYSQYVFTGDLPSVWTLTQLLVDPTSALGRMGTVSLGTRALDDDPLAALFKTNANALISLADRQSVSNAQARWATFKQGAWMLFNIALPFLGRNVGIAAWIWQIMDDLQQVSEAVESDDSDRGWTAMTDLLLTLGMVLAHQAASRHGPVNRARKLPGLPLETPEILPATKPVVTRLPDLQRLPPTHEAALHAVAALPASSLGTFLDELAIAEPKGMSVGTSAPGPHQYLGSHNGKWYAQVGQRWFETTLNDNGDVQIIDSRQSPTRNGPLLVKNEKGQWFIDLRLRLRGAGKAQQRLERENAQRHAELKRQMAVFESQADRREAELNEAEENAQSATATDAHRRIYLETLDAQIALVIGNIEQMKAINSRDTIANYREAMISRLRFQLSLVEKWFVHQRPVFQEQLGRSEESLDSDAAANTQIARQTYQHLSDLTEGYINKIELAQSVFEQLNLLGKGGAEASREFRVILPSFDLQELKLFQITLAQELCVDESSAAPILDVRQALDAVVEDAALSIQSSLDLAAEDDILRLPERIDGLSDVLEQLTTVNQRIVDLPAEFPGQLLQPPLDLMRQRIEAFQQRTETHLASLLLERQSLAPQPGPSRPSTAPNKRIVKTRFRGTVVGQLRSDPQMKGSAFLDVTSALSGKITTFHEKSPGVWVERVKPTTASSTPNTPTLANSIVQGQTLLDGVEAFIRRTETHSKGLRRIPVEIEEMFHQQAHRLNEAANVIEEALTSSNSTDGGPGSAVTVAKQLNDEATRLYGKGHQVRVSMTKLQPPTAGRVQWLHEQGEVNIVKSPGRRLLKSRKKDYLDEYEIRDASDQSVLWYAHFHYGDAAAPVQHFTAAHLKTAEQRHLGGAREARGSNDNLRAISIYRSEISPQLAKALFFARKTATVPPS